VILTFDDNTISTSRKS